MKKLLTDAMCRVLRYASHPMGMLLAAPIFLQRPGAFEHCLWPPRRPLDAGDRERSCIPFSLAIPYSVQEEPKP